MAKKKDRCISLIEESKNKIQSSNDISIVKHETKNIFDYEIQLRRCENKMIEILELVYADVKAVFPSKTNDVGDISKEEEIKFSTDPEDMDSITPQDMYMIDAISTLFSVPQNNIFVQGKIE